jgi:hypothetical protein
MRIIDPTFTLPCGVGSDHATSGLCLGIDPLDFNVVLEQP